MELGLLKPYMAWLLGPNSIMALELDPLGHSGLLSMNFDYEETWSQRPIALS